MKISSQHLVIICLLLSSMGLIMPIEKVQANNQSLKYRANYTKPHADISLSYERPKNILLGASQDIDFVIKSNFHSNSLKVSIRTEPSLQILSNSSYQFDSYNEQGHRFTLQLKGLAPGRFYIDINATITVNGKVQARSFAIPVNVGDPTNARFKAKPTRNEGYKLIPSQGVISMPAEEISE